MQDLAIHALLNALAQTPETNNLWFADENSLPALPALGVHAAKLTIVTNRFDIYEQALHLGITAEFNDADLSALTNENFDNLFIRISKEKPLTHHLINQALQFMGSGRLHIAGFKGEGIKTYLKKVTAQFTNNPIHQKDKDSHYAMFSRPIADTEALDTQNYTQLRTIGRWCDIAIQSKPGVFGFEKIDEGSTYLIETLEALNIPPTLNNHDLLDLGCGYGFLSIAAHRWQHASLSATDNNAAAIIAITENAKTLGANWEISASDAGDNFIKIGQSFDTLLCNPPFHQGFSTSSELTQKFVHHTAKLIKPTGQAFFVTNSFIPVEAAASDYFAGIEQLANNRRFKVTRLSKPKKVKRS